MAKVSWLVPVYNAAPYLEPSLRSIRDQTFTDFEVVIVDDGSTDGSADIIKSFCAADPRFRAFHKPNSGIVDTLNLGLSYCSGDYTARMDGDDISEPTRLAVQVAFMDHHPACVAAGTRTVIIDETGAVVRNAAATTWKSPGPTGFPRRAVTLTHPTIMARTAVLRAVGGYRDQFLAAEDYELLFRLARQGEIVELNERLLRYRVHSLSESATKIEQQRISSLKAEIADYLSDFTTDETLVQDILDSRTVGDLCRTASQAGHGLPDAATLQTYFHAEYLRRATYRLSISESRGIAADTFAQVMIMLPRLRSATVRYFLLKAIRELSRWALVTVTRRNGPPSRSRPVIGMR